MYTLLSHTDLTSHFQVLGTPTEKEWEGVTRLRGYRQNVEKIGLYRGQKLGFAFPRLYDIAEGEILATAFLQVSVPTFYFSIHTEWNRSK